MTHAFVRTPYPGIIVANMGYMTLNVNGAHQDSVGNKKYVNF